MSDRGEIHNPDRAKQLRDFSTLRYGNITPTDVDGLIEYHNKGYILLELKYLDAPFTYGQKLAYERLTDDLERAGKTTICIIAIHNVADPGISIQVADTAVSEYRWKGEWKEPKYQTTTGQLMNRFISFLDDVNTSK